MDILLLILELLGTLAFAASGALTGLRKNMDIFGVCILGLTTAVGGGVIRDLSLGNTPPATFQNPVYATVAVITALVLFLSKLRHFLMHNVHLFDRVLFWMDTAGLGIFTVVGIRIAYAHVPNASLFLLIFVGVITGVGGGILRDILAGIKGKFLLSQVDCPENRYLYKDFDILDYTRAHTMANRTKAGAQFGELLIGNYDLLERERQKPEQMSLAEMMGLTTDPKTILKERILPCKTRNTI